MEIAKRCVLWVALIGAAGCDDGAAAGGQDDAEAGEAGALDGGRPDAARPDARVPDAMAGDAMVGDAMVGDASMSDARAGDAMPGDAGVAGGAAGLRLGAGLVVDERREGRVRVSQGAVRSESERFRLRGRIQP